MTQALVDPSKPYGPENPYASAVTGPTPHTPTPLPSPAATGSASAAAAYQFTVKAYGAKGDGSSDDTAAVNAAVAAAFAYATSTGNHFAEILFEDKIYLLSGSLSQGGAAKTNALIPLPMVAATAPKVTLAFKGVGEAAALPLGTQTTGQKSGTVLKTAVVGSNDGTYGEASVIGGPTPAQGGGFNNGSNSLFTNLCVKLDDITISLPNNPTMCGVDFRGVAEVQCGSLGVYVDVAINAITLPSSGWQFGLAMPEARNNALCQVERYGCYGCNYGIMVSEHTTVDWLATVCCLAGIVVGKYAGPHHAKIGYAVVELCQIGVASIGSDSYGYINIDLLDYEPQLGGGFTTQFSIISIIDDSNYLSHFGIRNQYDKMQGRINVNTNGDPLYNYGPGPAGAGSDRIIGGGMLSVYCVNTASGDPSSTYNLLQPTVSGSATAFKNPYYKDATVYIAGGTVSAIAVDGLTLGVTSGMVVVPSGRSITLTYTAAPTWKWVLN